MSKKCENCKYCKDSQDSKNMRDMKWFLILNFWVKFFLIQILTSSSFGYNFIFTFIWLFRLWGRCFSIGIVTWSFKFFVGIWIIVGDGLAVRKYWMNLFWVYLECALGLNIFWCFRMVFSYELYFNRFDLLLRVTNFFLSYFLHWFSLLLFFFFILLK